MRRGATAAVILALLTGLVLGQIGRLSVSHVRVGESNVSPRALATARAFYESFDRLLDSGDRSIASTVAPGFIDHSGNSDNQRTLTEMIDWTLALRATWPHLRMQVVDLQQQGQFITVRLDIHPGVPSQMSSVPLLAAPPQHVTELLRVEGAAVSERWSAGGQLPVATFSAAIDDFWEDAGSVTPAIERVVLESGQSLQRAYRGTVVLWSEAGRIFLDRDGVDLSGNRRPTRQPLEAGQVRMLDGVGQFTLRNEGSEPARLWLLSTDVSRVERNAIGDATAAPGQLRAVAFLPLPGSGDRRSRPRRVSITHITLPPGSTVAPHAPGVVEAIAVVSGAIELTVDLGRALRCADGATAQPFDGTITLNAGAGVSANAMASLGYRTAGSQPATLLVMHIESPLAMLSTTS